MLSTARAAWIDEEKHQPESKYKKAACMLDTSRRSFLPLPSESSLDAMAARTKATKKVGEKMYSF